MGLRLTVALCAASSFACAIVACGLESGGILTPVTDGGTEDATEKDVNPQSCGDAAACLKPFGPPWQLTARLATATDPCPKNFVVSDNIKDFTVASGSCACSCDPQGTPGCGSSIFTAGYTLFSCVLFDGGALPADGTCSFKGGGGGVYVYLAASAPPLVGVTCAATRLGDAGVDSVPVRLCDPSCQADFCGQVGATATACIVAPGDLTCPSGFNQRTLLAAGASPTCGACKCAPPTGTCTGTVHTDYYDSTCNQDTWQFPADGTCNLPVTVNSSFSSLWETATPPSSASCGAPTDPGGDAGPVGVKTLCCP